MTPPLRATGTVPQHMQALANANRTRLARAALKRDIADGTKTVADVIRDIPWEAASMTIGDLLMSQHRWGPTLARRLLAGVPLKESKTLESMTARQRDAVVARLAGEGHVTDPFAAPRCAPVAARQAPDLDDYLSVPIRVRRAA